MIYFMLLGIILTLALRRNPLRMLDNVRFRYPFIMISAFLIQNILFVFFKLNTVQYDYLLEITFLLMIVGLLFNKTIKGVKWVISGIVVNLLSLIIHDGRMPVMERAMEVARVTVPPDDARHQTMSGDAIWWLGDWIPLYKVVASPGDILVGIGIIIFIAANSIKKDIHV